MEIQQSGTAGSSSKSSSEPQSSNANDNSKPILMLELWETISKARSSIRVLRSIPSFVFLSSFPHSQNPARALMQCSEAYKAISSYLLEPISGSGDDPLCQWLYDTFETEDPNLRLLVLSFIPLVAGLYLSRVVSTASDSPIHSLAGFESVLLALYASETKARGRGPMLISIPDMSQPSLYHTPRRHRVAAQNLPSVEVLCPPLELLTAVKSTKRACVVAIALECYFKEIPEMPGWSKLDLCQFVAGWAGMNCSCKTELDGNSDGDNSDLNQSVSEIRVADETRGSRRTKGKEKLEIGETSKEIEVSRGSRIPLPWVLLQPVLRILGHCLFEPMNSQDVRDAASAAVRCLYARSSHELVPQAILATRSLIQLDNRARFAANAASNANTPAVV